MTKVKTPSKKKVATSGMRNVMAFPRMKEFYEALVDRLHMVLDRFYLEEEFTFFLNALPRNHEVGAQIQVPRFQGVKLIYGGIAKQRELLEKCEKESRIIELDDAWNSLDISSNLDLDIEKRLAVSSDLYTQFAAGVFSVKDVKAGTMTSYFEKVVKLTDKTRDIYPNQEQIREHEILKYFNLIQDYCYFSVPLIQFAEFDGVVHIVLHEKDLKTFGEFNSKGEFQVTNKKQVGNLIKQFSVEYEGLILDWDIVEGDKWKERSLKALIDKAFDPELYNRLDTNPILHELNYKDYYQKHKGYFYKRFEYSSEMPLVVKDQYRRIAIMSILIDSFAHNISAHSLTALEWSFKQRGELLKKLESSTSDEQQDLLKKIEGLPLMPNNNHLDNEIHPFLRFMLDKGAFWTGLTRETNFGGKISSLFSVLWYNFVNNPLYLGTIAFSEGIRMIRIRITILAPQQPEAGILYKKRVKLDGEFATIDLSHMYHDEESKDEERISKYVTKGKEYKDIKKEMMRFRAFFPGGVVGQHAFFTILENEIRNVKHFGEKALKDMRKNGLTLNISLEEDTYAQKKHETKYYKIGVWIKHKVKIDEELLRVRLDKLWGDIITDKSYRPRLGGIFQDKVCAGMLFNNEFSSIQDLTSDRSKRFYPYIKVGCSTADDLQKNDLIEEFEISARRFYHKEDNKVSLPFFQKSFQPQYGYYKKFFHLWKGEEIYHAKSVEDIDNPWENLARFSFIYLPLNSPVTHFQKLREKGIIRIIDRPAKDQLSAYRSWLSIWLKDKVQEKIVFSVKKQPASVLLYKNGKAIYFPEEELPKLNGKSHKIPLVHGHGERDAQRGIVRIRQHGIFRRYFCEGQAPEDAEMPENKAIELFEVLNTRICMFDNRIANRIATSGTDVYQDKLNCVIHKEEKKLWQQEKTTGFHRYHFLVVHLSFIESFTDRNGRKKYHEDNIKEFIREEVIKDWKVEKNFMLVITTGRGRTAWWENLNPIHKKRLIDLPAEEEQGDPQDASLPYSSFVTFRPVESLIAAVENSLSMKDDLELKYRLVKVLFGS
ncbi:MAG: hypothetical protein R2824_09775 [Saprospiraceae bacterium]|nr:hypothetical protein [Lewinella sp.]